MAGNGNRRWAAAAVALGLCGGVARADDALDRLKAMRAVADQKAEATVRTAVQDAEAQAKTSRESAVKALKQLVLSLDLSSEITADKRTKLVADVQAKIAALEGKPAAPTSPANDPKSVAQRAAQRKQWEAASAEVTAVREAVAEVEKLYTANKFVEARTKIDALYKKYPHNLAAQLLAGQGFLSDRVAEAKRLTREMAERSTIALNDVSQSAMPAKADMELAKDWKERQALRQRMEPKLLGPEEEALLKALEAPVTVELKGRPLEYALQDISNLIGKPIYIDEESLKDVGADKQRQVNSPGGVSARTALRAVLQSERLTFIIKDKMIMVLSLEKAREQLVTRSYYLGDVVAGSGTFGNPLQWGTVTADQQTQQNAQFLIDAITRSVDPMVWSTKNGPATIFFNPLSMSVVVRAPAEVHATLGPKLTGR
ncbi:MAG: hypothetical protein U0871_28535 [Gemmataceae bacterium]